MNAYAQGQLHVIGRRYIARTLKELSDLHKDIKEAKAGHGESLPHLAQSAHRISGSAAMFGFEEVSACATRMERLVAALEAKRRNGFEFSELDTIALELEGAIRRAAKSRGIAERFER